MADHRKCLQCSKIFNALNKQQKFCSRQCKKDFHNKLYYDTHIAQPREEKAKERDAELMPMLQAAIPSELRSLPKSAVQGQPIFIEYEVMSFRIGSFEDVQAFIDLHQKHESEDGNGKHKFEQGRMILHFYTCESCSVGKTKKVAVRSRLKKTITSDQARQNFYAGMGKDRKNAQIKASTG